MRFPRELKRLRELDHHADDNPVVRLREPDVVHLALFLANGFFCNADRTQDFHNAGAQSRHERAHWRCGKESGEEGALGDRENELRATDVEQVRVPVSESRRGRSRRGVGRDLHAVEEAGGAAKGEHGDVSSTSESLTFACGWTFIGRTREVVTRAMDEYQEFLDDFGGPPLDDAAIAALLARARATDDVDLRRLVKQFQAVRSAASWLLQHIEQAEGARAIEENFQLKIARLFVRNQ